VSVTAAGGTIACDSSGLVLTVSSTNFASIAASGITTTGKSGYTAAYNISNLAGRTCSSRFGAASWAIDSKRPSFATLSVGPATDTTTCSTGTDGSCRGVVTKFASALTAISMRHSCAIRSSDGAVLCSGNN
jgi:hypothetical protein